MYRGAHSVLEHRLGATSVAAFITKRAALLRSQRSVRYFCGRRLWRGPSAAEGESLGVAIGGELRAMLNMDFRELRKAEVQLRRIHLPRTPVNELVGRHLVSLPENVVTLANYCGGHSLNHIDPVATNIPDLLAI